MKKRAESAILSYLSGVGSATRREVLDGAIEKYGLPGRELASHSVSGHYGSVRSMIGATLGELVRVGEIARGGRGYLLSGDREISVSADACERKILAALKNRSFTEDSLIASLAKSFGTDTTASYRDDQALEGTVREVLKKLIDAEEIVLNDGRYKLCQSLKLSNEPLELPEFKSAFFMLLSERGGAAFERYVAGLLEKYYQMTGREVLLLEIPGGSADGGIDIEVETVDGLGFVDRVLSQTKCRSRLHVTEKEVREFYGALCAKDGTRGIYVTTSTFHPMAQRFLDSLDNVVGIDGEKLFSLALFTSYGIRLTRAGYLFDKTVFD